MPQQFRGIGVSPGVALGRVYVLHTESLPVVPDPIPPERVDAEIARFECARDEARIQLAELRERVRHALGGTYAGILDAQLLILDDAQFVAQTIRRIRVGRVSARWALKQVIDDYLRRFDAMDDAYLRERGGDLSDVHLRLQRRLRGDGERPEDAPGGPLIAVARSLGPSDAVELARRGVVGLATDDGGRTSHTAILAQALSVPAVAGLRGLSERARNGDAIVLDGASGEVLLHPNAEELRRSEAARVSWLDAEAQAAARARAARTTTADGVEVALRANIEFAHDVGAALRYGAEGIGLYRSEFLFLARSPELPSEEEHFETYARIAREVAPHPAVIRTLDLGGEKYFHDVLAHDESNPVLGLRGVRFCLERRDVFRPQLRGLLRASTAENLRVMLPLVTTVEEIQEVRRMFAAEVAHLRAEGHSVRETLPLGIMIEVPAAAIAADVLAREADFLSLGTNDLIQYALAVDRANAAVSYLYQPLHPGVLRMLRCTIDAARNAGIPFGICGEMAADPALAALLVGLGFRELSVQPRAVPALREAIARVDSVEARRLAQEALAPAPLPRDEWTTESALRRGVGGDGA